MKFIYPYQMYSKSVHALRKAAGFKVIKTKDSAYRHNRDKILVNWGSTARALQAHQADGPVINPTQAVALCANKIRFFQAVEEAARCPDFTTDGNEARKWAEDSVVVARTKINAHSGEGIVFSDEDPDFWTKGKLYTRYVPKLQEFRVHVFRGRVIDIQQKKLRKQDEDGNPVEKEQINWRVRSYKNGFVFARQDLVVPDDVTRQAVAAFGSIRGLDFGAFDVIYNKKEDRAYVLECNTAPGLEGSTLDNYVKEFNNL